MIKFKKFDGHRADEDLTTFCSQEKIKYVNLVATLRTHTLYDYADRKSDKLKPEYILVYEEL